MSKKNTQSKPITIDGKTYKVYKSDYVPKGSIYLSPDLYRKFIEENED